MIRTWDILVVGAGPAGARAAELFAKRGLNVLLLDPKAPWEKPCGGGLTAAALNNTPELRELTGEGQLIDELVVTAPSGATAIVPLRRPYLVVSRLALSRWGLDRAQAAGAHFLSAGAASVAREHAIWRITDSEGSVHRARWLLAADGATSRLRRLLAPDLRPELAPTRVAYPRLRSRQTRAVFLFLAATDGYLWDFPRPDHRSIGVGVPPGTYARLALDQAIGQYQVAEAYEPVEGGFRGAVIATADWKSGDFDDLAARDHALLGDAAGLADPATGEGIDYALRSATLAARAFDVDAGFANYPALIRTAFEKEFQRARLVRHWLYRPGIADRLIRHAARSPRGAVLLASLVDAVNEHGSLRAALGRALLLLPARERKRTAEPPCRCSDQPGHLPRPAG